MAYQPYSDGQPQQQYGQPYAQDAYGQPYGQQQPVASYGQQQPSYASPPPSGQYPTVLLHGSGQQDAEFAPQPMYAPPVVGGANYAPSGSGGHDGSNDGFVGAMPGGGEPGQKMDFAQVEAQANNSGYRDLGFLIAFVLHIVGMLILAGVHGPGLVRDLHNTEPKPTVGEEPRQTSDSLMISLLIVSAVIGVAFSIFWLGVLQRFAAKIIHVCLVANIVVAAVGAIAAFAAGQILMGVVYVIIAALMGVYYYYVRARIPFATAVLHSSIQSIKENGGPIWVVYGLALFQIGWLALWAFIFTAVYHAANRVVTETDPATGAVYQYRVSNGSGLQFLQFFCVLSLFWTCQVLRGIGHVTAGGVVASWWFTPGSPAPTMSSFKRAVTTSLGSICFAALLVALVETTRFLLRSARRDAFREIVDCLLGILERALKWFNMYALATVAIFGDDFLTSAKRTGQLFRAELFTAVINDDLSSTVLVAGSILAGVVAGIVGAVWASAKSVEGWVVCAILSFIVGALVASLAMGVIRSAVTTTFVAWASDPATLSQNRPVEFNRIIEAGQHKYANQGIGAYSGQRV